MSSSHPFVHHTGGVVSCSCDLCNKLILVFILLPTGSEEREVLGVGSIPIAIFPSCQYIQTLHHSCIDINIVG